MTVKQFYLEVLNLEDKLRNPRYSDARDILEEELVVAKRRYRRALHREAVALTINPEWHFDNTETTCWTTYLVDMTGHIPQGLTDPVKVKRWVTNYVWSNFATDSNDSYDCSGDWYTQEVRVAHIKNNRFKVYERMNLDI